MQNLSREFVYSFCRLLLVVSTPVPEEDHGLVLDFWVRFLTRILNKECHDTSIFTEIEKAERSRPALEQPGKEGGWLHSRLDPINKT